MRKIDGMEIIETGDIIKDSKNNLLGTVISEIDCCLLLDTGLEIELSDVEKVEPK